MNSRIRSTQDVMTQGPEQAALSDVNREESRRAHNFSYISYSYVVEAEGSESLGMGRGGVWLDGEFRGDDQSAPSVNHYNHFQ